MAVRPFRKVFLFYHRMLKVGNVKIYSSSAQQRSLFRGAEFKCQCTDIRCLPFFFHYSIFRNKIFIILCEKFLSQKQFCIFCLCIRNMIDKDILSNLTVYRNKSLPYYHTIALLIQPFIRCQGTRIRKSFQPLNTI